MGITMNCSNQSRIWDYFQRQAHFSGPTLLITPLEVCRALPKVRLVGDQAGHLFAQSDPCPSAPYSALPHWGGPRRLQGQRSQSATAKTRGRRRIGTRVFQPWWSTSEVPVLLGAVQLSQGLEAPSPLFDLPALE